MKKLMTMFLFLVFSNIFYGQDANALKKQKSEAKVENTVSNKIDAKVKEEKLKADANKTDAKIKSEKLEGKAKAETNKANAKIKSESKKTKDKVTGKYKGKKVYTGPQGGRYYINSNGNKTYIKD